MERRMQCIPVLVMLLSLLCGCAGTTVHREDQLAMLTQPTAAVTEVPETAPVQQTVPPQTQGASASQPVPPATQPEPAGTEPSHTTSPPRVPEPTEPVQTTAQTEPDPTETEPQPVLTAEAIIRAINDRRLSAGLAPLTVRSQETAAAKVRAEEISRNFRHERPDGSQWITALEAAGWTGTRAEENLLKASPGFSPEELVNMWMLNAPQRDIILDPEFTFLGVGLCCGSLVFCCAVFSA